MAVIDCSGGKKCGKEAKLSCQKEKRGGNCVLGGYEVGGWGGGREPISKCCDVSNVRSKEGRPIRSKGQCRGD